MKFAETLFEIARNDLEASKGLFERELYPQAVFLLAAKYRESDQIFWFIERCNKGG